MILRLLMHIDMWIHIKYDKCRVQISESKSVHESSGSRVMCLSMLVSRSLRWVMWMMNYDRHLMVWENVW